ncbi:MAG: ABC transporter substrate-binding protein [Chloroflexota bacterium]
MFEQKTARGTITRRAMFLAGASGAGLTAALALGACGQSTSGGGGSGQQPASGGPPVEITYQTFFPQQRLDLMAPAFRVFEEQHPNIKLNVVYAADHRDKLNTQIVADSAPDSFIHDVWSTAKYVDAGALMDFTGRLKVDKIDLARDYYLIGVEQWCDKTYAIPFYVTSMLLAYNKNLLQKFGAPDPWQKYNGKWTWDEFLEVTRLVTRPPGGEYAQGTFGLAVDGNGTGNIDRNYQMWMTSNGGETYDVQKMRYTLDDPKTIEAYDFMVKMVHDHKVMVGPEEWSAITKAVTGEPFIAGLIAFRQESTGRLALYAQEIGNRFEWDVVPYPSGSKSQPFIGHSDADTTQVYAKTKHPDQAYTFAKFMGGEVMQRTLAENKLLIPGLRKAAEDKATFLKPPPNHVAAFLEPLRTGLFRTSFYHWNGLQALDLQNEQLRAAMSREKTAREALMEANRAANAVVKYGNCRQTVTWKTR